MVGDLGASDAGRDIAYEIKNRMWPSVALAFPTFFARRLCDCCVFFGIGVFPAHEA